MHQIHLQETMPKISNNLCSFVFTPQPGAPHFRSRCRPSTRAILYPYVPLVTTVASLLLVTDVRNPPQGSEFNCFKSYCAPLNYYSKNQNAERDRMNK